MNKLMMDLFDLMLMHSNQELMQMLVVDTLQHHKLGMFDSCATMHNYHYLQAMQMVVVLVIVINHDNY